MPALLLEGPFESDYSLAIVNRNLAQAMLRLGIGLKLHQRDNVPSYFPSDDFLSRHKELAPLFVRDIATMAVDVHSRYLYPPYVDNFRGSLRVVHCYGWEESAFPRQFVEGFNRGLDLITVMSAYVRDVLTQNGVTVPVGIVGLGADHLLSVPAKQPTGFQPGAFDFLHVSSCFPRKAPEILVRAFCLEFTRGDGVRLLIKTFANPHNEIRRIVEEFEQQYPDHAPIEILEEPFSPGEMRYLYEHAGCLVSASRGEGFGLPVAEAMFAGCPVIATIYSGQADLCTAEHCWPVDFTIEPARTHLTEGPSFWANPSMDSLRRQMRAVYRASAQERVERTALARQFVADRFTWERVAARHWELCRNALAARRRPITATAALGLNGSRPAIGFITTWNVKCGIAEYARYLATSLPDGFPIAIFANRSWETVRPDEDYVLRCWDAKDEPRAAAEITELAGAIVNSGVQAASLQYNFGFFAPSDVGLLFERLRRAGLVTSITLHAIQHDNFAHLKSALRNADFCICHRQADVDALRGLGLDNVLLMQQGIVPFHLDERQAAVVRRPRLHFVVSCFGFFLPPKGIYQLIQAFALAKNVQPLLRLKLMNSLYPLPESPAYAQQCIRLIQEKGLGGDVEICTAFLPHEQILRELADSDLVVLPYLRSTESSSAAGSFAIASLAPVLCSDLPLFEGLGDTVHRFPAGNVIALANKILQLAGDPPELSRRSGAQQELVRRLAWPAIARDFADLITRHAAGKRGAATTPV